MEGNMPRGRRGAGEGSVYMNDKGLWCATVELGTGPDGKRRRKVVKAKTKAVVLAKVAEVRGQEPQLRDRVAAGRPLVDRRLSTAAFLDQWLEDVVAARVRAGDMKASSEARYRQVVRLYLSPALGATPLASLDAEDVHGLLRGLEAEGLSASTVKQARSILHAALKHAERWGKVDRNPVTAVDGPKRPGTRLDDALDAGEARRLLEVTEDHRLHALAVLVLRLGLRKGEALALHWRDVDLKAKTLRVEGTRTRVAGLGVIETAAKTSGSARTVPLPASVAVALRAHQRAWKRERLALGTRWAGGDHVFVTELGNPIDPRNILTTWHSWTEAAGLGKRRMHAGRHTAATLLLDQGVPLEVVSAILGHAGLAITADVYARPTMDAKRRALEALDGIG
jgi:integrase